ncbi:MAG TPA: DUF6350 family protein [Actinoplanes sp.]|nr:DUF6350 family protein [Actinoplanes sp.]
MSNTPDRPAEPDRHTVPVDTANHETRPVDVDAAARPTVRLDRATVLLDRADHETVKLPGQRRPPDRPGRAPLIVAAGAATCWAALVSYLPVAAVIGLARTLEGAGGLGGAAAAGLAAWLLGHGVPLGTSIGPLALAPLLLTLLALWRLSRAGLHITRAIGARHSGSPRDALAVAGAAGVWYALIGALGAAIISGPGTEISAARAAVHLFLLGAAGALVGSVRSTDALGVVARRIPRTLRHGIHTGLVAALLMLAAGAACTGLAVAVGGGEAADMIATYRTGVAGQAGITLVSLAYGGNAAVWAAAYLLGPGFALGTESSVRLTEVTVGPLPTLPLLAALPDGPIGAAGALLLAVPVLAAMVAGWLLARRLIRGLTDRAGPGVHLPPWSLVLGATLVAGPVAGLVLGALAWLSGGSLGGGRLGEIGPVPWQVALVATGVVAVSAAIGAAAGRTFGRRPE